VPVVDIFRLRIPRLPGRLFRHADPVRTFPDVRGAGAFQAGPRGEEQAQRQQSGGNNGSRASTCGTPVSRHDVCSPVRILSRPSLCPSIPASLQGRLIPAAATAVTITVAGTHPMLPGPDQIVACPNGQGLEKYRTLVSGNTFGARVWTGGSRNRQGHVTVGRSSS
jgi:hypothetical protein